MHAVSQGFSVSWLAYSMTVGCGLHSLCDCGYLLAFVCAQVRFMWLWNMYRRLDWCGDRCSGAGLLRVYAKWRGIYSVVHFLLIEQTVMSRVCNT